MHLSFSPSVKHLMVLSKQISAYYRHNQLSPIHLLAAITQYPSCRAHALLSHLVASIAPLKTLVEQYLEAEAPMGRDELSSNPFNQLLRQAYQIAQEQQQATIDSTHILLALCAPASELHQLLKDQGLSAARICWAMEEQLEPINTGNAEQRDAGSTSSSATPVLEECSIDLSEWAKQDKVDPIVGRDQEIERLVELLGRRKKNNVLLIGEPGVGKTALVEGLALSIHQRNVPPALQGKRIMALDMAALLAGTKYRGQLEERIQHILKEVEASPDILLFIDEFHALIGAGGVPGSLDVANLLKPALARGTVRCIGATTLREYRQYIESDGALVRRFQTLYVPPTTPEITLAILKRLQPKYEAHHQVAYTPDALEACVRLSDRYLRSKKLPDKAIDILDEAGARARAQKLPTTSSLTSQLQARLELLQQEKQDRVKSQAYEAIAMLHEQEKQVCQELQEAQRMFEQEAVPGTLVDVDMVTDVVAATARIPLGRLKASEQANVQQLSTALRDTIFGQDHVIEDLVKALQRSRMGLKPAYQPIGSFLFVGPTGVGKTALARALATHYFATPDALIRVDMSEYRESFNASRLLGAPPGYVGYESGGQLTEKVRHNPYSLILLDEIEKAHPSIHHLLLQVLDEGTLTDSLGNQVDFRHTIIIMTANVGMRQLEEFGTGIGFTAGQHDAAQEATEIISKAIRQQFSPEFLNRLSGVLHFRPLGEVHFQSIITQQLNLVSEQLAASHYTLHLTPSAKTFLTAQMQTLQQSGRSLVRLIQTHVLDPLAAEMLQHTHPKGTRFRLHYNKGGQKLALQAQVPAGIVCTG